MTTLGPTGRKKGQWPEKPPASPSLAGERLADECEAFLQGRFAELQRSRQEPVEAWAWVNRVAHAEPKELKALASRGRPWRGAGFRDWRSGSRRWNRAVSRVARELLCLAGDKPRAIRRLQVRALVPLELELSERGTGITPEVMVARARAALYKKAGVRAREGSSAGTGGPLGEGRYCSRARRGWRRAADVALAVASVGVVGTLVALAALTGRSPRPSLPLYRYYLSRLSTLDYRALQSPAAFAWMTGGDKAPGWERGRDLPTFLLPWGPGGAGRYVGWLFAGAPGHLVKSGAASRLATEPLQGVNVAVDAGRVRFSGRSVDIQAVARAGHRLMVGGLEAPDLVVPAGAKVSFELVNDDKASAHGLAVVPAGVAASQMPMAEGRLAFAGSALWFLGDATAGGAPEGRFTFTATKPGTYRYIDPVPGQGRAGMAGTLEVVAAKS